MRQIVNQQHARRNRHGRASNAKGHILQSGEGEREGGEVHRAGRRARRERERRNRHDLASGVVARD